MTTNPRMTVATAGRENTNRARGSGSTHTTDTHGAAVDSIPVDRRRRRRAPGRETRFARSGIGFAALAVVLGSVACETEPATAPEPAWSDDAALVQIDAAAGVVEAAADGAGAPGSLFDRLAGEIPGFAGFYFDNGCNLVVVLTHPAQAGHASEVLTPLLHRFLRSARRRCPRGAAVVVQHGEYDWYALNGYLAALRPLKRLRGVGRLAISVPANAIVVAIAAEAVAPKVLEAADGLGVPAGVLELIVGGAGR